MSQRILAFIPARANSKRIPGKNKKPFRGKPLIEWTLQAALDAKYITKIVVNTDDAEILNLDSKYPKIEFYSRPKSLGADETPTIDVVLEYLKNKTESFDAIVLLQPTSPLRTTRHIEEAIEKFMSSGAPQLVSVKKMSDNLGHLVAVENKSVKLLNRAIPALAQSQNQFFALNGAIYISKPATLTEQKTFLGETVETYLMSEFVSVDIDTIEDWDRAEVFANFKN